MKKQFLFMAMAISLLFSLAPVNSACAASGRMKANIPFGFMVGEITLEAGQYIIDGTMERNSLLISTMDGKKNLFTNVFGGESGRKPYRSKLVFSRYGDKHFLSQVWAENCESAMQLPVSSAERELKQLKYLTQNEMKPDLITVLGQ